MKTLIAAAEPPERPRNETVAWNSGASTTSTNTAVTYGWVQIDRKK